MGKISMDRALKRMKITYKKSPYDLEKYSEQVKKLSIEYVEHIEPINVDRPFIEMKTVFMLQQNECFNKTWRG